LPEPTVELLDEGIVARSARSAEVELDSVPIGPVIEPPGGELGPIVAAYRPRRLTCGDDPSEVSRDIPAREA
jgi:hypothetical protein